MALRALSLFSGVGGLDLGVRAAFGRHGIRTRTVCYVESEAYCNAVLAARMADGALDVAPVWSDVRTFDGLRWRDAVDLVLGGFPCQDISVAGRGAGIHGERSGLWWEYARIIREVQPRWVAIENVPPVLAATNAGPVLGTLAALGFDAEWISVRASDVGAPHRRERVFILAHTSSSGLEVGGCEPGDTGAEREAAERSGAGVAWPPGPDDLDAWAAVLERRPWLAPATECAVRRGADGAPTWLDAAVVERSHRLRALGNAVVPAQAEAAFFDLIGRILF